MRPGADTVRPRVATGFQCVPSVLVKQAAVVHALCEVAVHQTHWPWGPSSGFKLHKRTG